MKETPTRVPVIRCSECTHYLRTRTGASSFMSQYDGAPIFKFKCAIDMADLRDGQVWASCDHMKIKH